MTPRILRAILLTTLVPLVTGNTLRAQGTSATARAIVGALRSSTPPTPFQAVTAMPTLTKDEQTEFNAAGRAAVQAAMAISGESLTPNDAFQVQNTFTAFRTRGLSSPLNRDLLTRFEARIKLIDKDTLNRWHQATQKLAYSPEGTGSLTLLVGAIAFQDYLFSGSNWKAGFANKSLTRLESVSPEAVVSLSEAAGLSTDLRRFAAYALVAVDELFSNDKFQQAVFEREIAGVRVLLASK